MIWIIILGLIAGYREVMILVYKTYYEGDGILHSYYRPDTYRDWFWTTDQNSKWKNFDSFHASNGLFTLVFAYALYAQPEFIFYLLNQFWTIIVHIVLAWVVFFYARNIMMHVILPKKPILRYLIPLIKK